MKQFKIAFIVLLLSLFSSGCYTVVYNSVDEDKYGKEVVYNPPARPVSPEPPIRPPVRPPVQPPVINPIIIIYPPITPPPPEYKTRPPENVGGNKKRNPEVIDPIRIGGGRGNDGGRK